jgi:hypothetical protein
MVDVCLRGVVFYKVQYGTNYVSLFKGSMRLNIGRFGSSKLLKEPLQKSTTRTTYPTKSLSRNVGIQASAQDMEIMVVTEEDEVVAEELFE